MPDSTDATKEVTIVSFSEFLEACPPNQLMHISDIATRRLEGSGPSFRLSTPELLLHCSSEICNGNRIFRSKTNEYFSTDEYREVFLKYTCSNCQKTERIYAIAIIRNNNSDLSGHAFKYGEIPPFGPPTPSRLITMIGPDREKFLKGRRCENQGLGIGAFIYYRRVVENQKNRILDEIVKVATKIGDDSSKIELLNRAIAETQFTKAMDMIKDAVPKSLGASGFMVGNT